MKGHGEKKSRKEEQAIIALLTASTIKEAANMVGIGEATLWRWMQESSFKEKFRSAKKQAFSQTVSRLQQSSGEAVETLRTIMNDITAPAPSRVTAAKSILEMAMKAVEFEELEARVEQLEEMLKEDGRLKGIR